MVYDLGGKFCIPAPAESGNVHWKEMDMEIEILDSIPKASYKYIDAHGRAGGDVLIDECAVGKPLCIGGRYGPVPVEKISTQDNLSFTIKLKDVADTFTLMNAVAYTNQIVQEALNLGADKVIVL